MTTIINKNYTELSITAANLIINLLQNKPDALICIPSGESPAGMFKHLVEAEANGKVDFSHCTFIGLDEWVGLGADNDGSCTQFLNEHFFHRIKTAPKSVKFFNAKAGDLDAECTAMNNFIAENGPLDLMIVGIGMNGHIGLNEPGTSFDVHAHHSPLDPLTISVGQKYFQKETMLTEGITLGLKHLQEAPMPVLLAAGAKKAAIIAKALNGQVTETLPASIFQKLEHATIVLDEAAARDLR
jgi:glucosamine-6-phosphate deaminase